MAKIFDILNGEVTLTPEALAIPAFSAIWENDKSEDKNKAKNEIKFVVFFCDSVNSPYKDFSEQERLDILKKDIFKNDKWKPSKAVEKAMEDFERLTETTSSKLLRSAKNATEKLARYFEEVDFTKIDSMGKPIYSARELASNLSAVGNIVKSLNSLENSVKREQIEDSRTRGGSEINYFEDPNNI